MADLLLKPKKGADLPPAEVFELSVEPTLVFQTTHETGPHLLDLTLFATGMTAEDIAQAESRNQRRMKPWSGRPQLIKELLPHIRNLYAASPTVSCIRLLDHLKWWWRFLDGCNDIAPVRSVADLDNIHYTTYRVKPCDRLCASKFFSLVGYARNALNLPDLYWTAIAKPSPAADLIAHEDVSRLYRYYQQRCKGTLLRFEADANELPTWTEILDLVTLFTILTGWNTQVALDVDTSQTNLDGSLTCIMPDAQNPLYSVISAVKKRAGGTIQEAHGLNKQRISCINIIKSLYRQTARLRARVNLELNILEDRRTDIEQRKINVERAEANALIREIAELKAKIRSPWLYLARNGEVIRVTSKVFSRGGTSPISKATEYINARLSVDEKPVAEGISMSDLRDAFISYRWHKGGYSWLTTMMAAGHTNLASLNAYLNKRQHHQASQLSFLMVGNSTWKTIVDLPSAAVKLMPTIIAARTHDVPEEKIVRWMSGKDLTIQGVGCRDYTRPPSKVAPRHKQGSGCRVQRCILCPTHAVLLPDSYIYIAKRLAELRYIQATMSLLAWVESDYEEEMSNADSALVLYDDVASKRELAYWEREIKEGRHIPMRMEGVND